MQQRIFCIVGLLLCVITTPLAAQDNQSGQFDYYVLALSWSPNWCLRRGDQIQSAQCETGKTFGWILHGLWPQYETGYPAYCKTPHRAPSRKMTADMVDIMGSSGLAWHQWKKHGTCTGLPAAAYFAKSRQAYEVIVRPSVFRQLKTDVRLPAAVVEQAFLAENPALTANMLTITCKGDHIQEARVCLSTSLSPRPCGADVSRDCRLSRAMFSAIGD
ncbi:MAG: ribonuclease T2 [Pseudomonadota bacterium]